MPTGSATPGWHGDGRRREPEAGRRCRGSPARYEPEPNGKYYAGLVVCVPGDFFSVYRVPGSASLDAWVTEVARQHRVRVHLIDTKYSAGTFNEIGKVVLSPRARLAAAGADLRHAVPEFQDGTYLEVGVKGDFAAARRILADLGDKVRVVEGDVVVALPPPVDEPAGREPA